MDMNKLNKSLGHGKIEVVNFDYGAKLTQADYERKIHELHIGHPPMPTAAQDMIAREGEMNLMIDYKLGENFPKEKREAMWQSQLKLDQGLLGKLLVGVIRHPLHPGDALARAQVGAFAKHLDRAELAGMFDLSEEELGRIL